MSTKSVLAMAAASFLAACSCLPPEQPAPAATPAAAAPAAAPVTLAKEAEQVIALAEKEPPAPSPMASPESAAPPPAGVSRCWLKGDLRTIATEQGQDGSCQVVYDSAGQNHVVANKSHDRTECTRLHERLKRNLLASGFSCE